MEKKVKRVCDGCHKQYSAYKDRCVRFCSRKCTDEFLRGENHPAWKGGTGGTCKVCGKIYSGRGRDCCSLKCSGVLRGKAQMGANNPFWKGGKVTNKKGYVLVRDPRKKSKNGYVPEHRLVMEREIGRQLWPWEIVHHKNAIKDDNRPENLQIVTYTTHAGEILCPKCDYVFFLH